MSLATLYTAEKLLVPWTAAPMDAAALFECPKWELTPKQQVTVAAYARELGNEQMQTGKHEEVLVSRRACDATIFWFPDCMPEVFQA